MEIVGGLNNFFQNRLQNISCSPPLQSYIVNVLSSNKTIDLSQESLTLFFSQAKFSNRFELYQQLGDWILKIQSFCKLKENSDYYNVLAQLSYYKCYKMINSWKLYEELADTFPNLVVNIQTEICSEPVYPKMFYHYFR